MNMVVSNVRTRAAKVWERALAVGLNMPKRSLVAGLSAGAGAHNSVLAAGGFAARAGAGLGGFLVGPGSAEATRPPKARTRAAADMMSSGT